jgi:signal transduction histidine kinase
VRIVQAAGAEAMEELGRLFGLLDAGTVGPAGHAASQGEHDLRALADRMRAGGLAVELETPGGLPGDATLAATVYRVVQEALTNAARHAPGAHVNVRLEQREGGLVVTVTDDGRAAPAPSPGGGFGLVGLAERVRALGGELSAGPRPGGGFAVSARLPAPAREEARA